MTPYFEPGIARCTGKRAPLLEGMLQFAKSEAIGTLKTRQGLSSSRLIVRPRGNSVNAGLEQP